MVRGAGLKKTVKYRWVEQPNGAYTIFSVPVFSTYTRDGESVGVNSLRGVVAAFQKMRATGYYPRVHIGHHADNGADRRGAGYLDNLFLSGKTIYADIVEIPKRIFAEIKQNKRYPYVSAEYSPEQRRISTVALLESQPPFFKFPLIDLVSEGEKPEKFSKNFSSWAARNKLISFQENGDKKMNENENEPVEEEKDEKLSEEGEAGDPVLEALARIETLLQAHDERLKTLYEMEMKWHEEEGEPVEEESEEIEENEESEVSEVISNPSSVAFSQLLRRVRKLEEKSGESAVERLESICKKNKLNFAEQKNILQRFSSLKDKEVYLATLSAPPRHPASNLEKFASVRTGESIHAKKALAKFNEILANESSPSTLKQFRAIWGNSPEKFVAFYAQFPEKLGEI